MNKHKRNRLALAAKVADARKAAKDAAARRSRPVFVSLHYSTSWCGADAIEITGPNIPRMLVEQGLSVQNWMLLAPGPITFPPSKSPVPVVITHVAISDGIDGKLLLSPTRLPRSVVLQPGEALHFPCLKIEVC